MGDEAAAPIDEGKTAPAASGETPPAAVKPDHVPDKFWADDGVNFQAWGESTKELEGKLRTRKDDLTKQVREEFEAERLANRPESADLYEARIPDSVQLPEGVEWEFSDDDPMLGWWRTFAHDNGMDQEGFDKGIEMYVQGQLANMPNPDSEIKALGEYGADRALRVANWANQNLSEDAYKALDGTINTAIGVAAMEEIMEKMGELKFSPELHTSESAGITLDDLQTMQKDPRYWNMNKRDPAFVQKVNDGFKRLVS